MQFKICSISRLKKLIIFCAGSSSVMVIHESNIILHLSGRLRWLQGEGPLPRTEQQARKLTISIYNRSQERVKKYFQSPIRNYEVLIA
jgi:hypothetical protein